MMWLNIIFVGDGSPVPRWVSRPEMGLPSQFTQYPIFERRDGKPVPYIGVIKS